MSSGSRQFGLSKSKITSFEQCPKRLWLQTHRPDLAELDAGAEARFAAGHEVGGAACALCSGGIMIEADPDLAAALQRTQELTSASAQDPLFEATFAHDGVLVRVDIMEPDGLGGWHVAEVKSSTSRKDYHVADLATQLWVLREAGVQVSSAAIRHLNNQFFLTEEGNYQGAFVDTPSLEDAKPLALKRPKLVAEIRSVLGGDEPARDPGDHCHDPFPCEFVAYCSRDLEMARYPISTLPRTGRQLAAKWAEHGIVELEDVPPGSFTNAIHARIHEATLSGVPYHDVDGARRIIGDWAYPRTYLDFETIAFALPRWLGTKPWEQVPFQFSAHIEDREGQITHREFLSLDGKDPRRACAEALVAHIPQDGAVIAYNAAFERTCILRLADRFSDLAADLKAIAARIVDLLPVTREHWYHRDQGGSWSIKVVLPTIGNSGDYAMLDVADGSAAQLAYLEAMAPVTTEARMAEIAQSLRTYCAKDTFAMVEVVRHLTDTK